ncbi:hypothetical protein [Paracoccus pacificus]|uniref:Uncharacterized protein n=1 Tax=Paracoccus pacificus TaxID=1463598 RepID=A0ABW4R6E2_9RHOB
MTRLLASLFIATLLSLPASAQDAAKDADPSGTQPATDAQTAAPADAEDDEQEGEDETGVHEAAGQFDYGFSGILARDNRTDLAPLVLGAGKPVATAEYTLKSGGYYRIAINADGSQELGLSGGDFFRAIWVNEIVVNDVEIRPMGVHSIEFDSPGTAVISFVAIVPGRYTLSVPGSSGDGLQAVFNIQ